MNDKIPCAICNRLFRQITKAHVATHGMTYAEYRKQFPDSLVVSESVASARSSAIKGNQFGKGYKHTDEARERMSKSRTGQKRGGYRKREITQQELTQRFTSRVEQSPGQGPNGDCWEWQGPRNNGGYGGFKIRKFRPDGTADWQWIGSHRFAFVLWAGEIPEGRLVLHHCDNPPCCNPEHLWLGDYADNLKDAETKGRKEPIQPAVGADNPEAFLTEDEVRAIRFSAGRKTQQEIADFFGVSQSHVAGIINRRCWKHVD